MECGEIVVEFETLPEMTSNPAWAEEICKILLDKMHQEYDKSGLKSVLRMTPNDNREMERPPQMRSGFYLDKMRETFDRTALAGADMLSIESVGGKELHDDALLMCDIQGVLFSQCVLGVRDMRFIWEDICSIAEANDSIAAGDTACGFGNTAMMLAHQRLIPKVFAAVVRPITAVRSLVAYETGAVGPGKDCGYENPILKAITGMPMSMEGKAASCAHLSPLGNIAAATCDLWSNESVQNLKLLGGFAPTCSLEQLEYDCRLMNLALTHNYGPPQQYRDMMVDSDSFLDPQAYVLTPDNVITFADTIVNASDYYQAGKEVALKAVEVLRDGHSRQLTQIPGKDMSFLDMIENSVKTMPESEDDFINQMMGVVDTSKFRPKDYGINDN